MRLLPLLLLGAVGCESAPTKRPCEFGVQVRVTDQAAEECEALGAVDHLGQKAENPRGCAPAGRVITNGTRDNLGHEFYEHVIPRECAK